MRRLDIQIDTEEVSRNENVAVVMMVEEEAEEEVERARRKET